MASPPRLVPERPLPPYAYVPGQSPHPVSDPAGHSYKRGVEKPQPLDPERWHESRDYLFGFDLFNYAYFWEAHETWEGLWHAAGRRGPLADFLKGLIKLAAARVKLLQAKPAGVRSHAARARELFQSVASRVGPKKTQFLGFVFDDLVALATRIETLARPSCAPSAESVSALVPRLFDMEQG